MRETTGLARTSDVDVAAALARSDLLPGATSESLAAVRAHTTVRILQPGQDLVRRGEEAGEVFVVVEGEARGRARLGRG